MQFEETQTQDEIDSKIKEFEERSRGAFAAQVIIQVSRSRQHLRTTS